MAKDNLLCSLLMEVWVHRVVYNKDAGKRETLSISEEGREAILQTVV